MPELGFNYRIPDVLCALGISQLAKLDRLVARRKAPTALYAERLASLAPAVRPATGSAWSDPALHLLTVLIDFEAPGTTRLAVVEALTVRGRRQPGPLHPRAPPALLPGPLRRPGPARRRRLVRPLPDAAAVSDDDGRRCGPGGRGADRSSP